MRGGRMFDLPSIWFCIKKTSFTLGHKSLQFVRFYNSRGICHYMSHTLFFKADSKKKFMEGEELNGQTHGREEAIPIG